MIPGKTISILFMISFLSHAVSAADSLSYSGRLVQTNGSPVVGPVDLKAELAYTNNLSTVLCSDDISGVALSKGVFHVKLDFTCTGGKALTEVLSQAPAGESVAIQITDVTNSKSYSYQAIHALPYANVASQLVQMAATNGQVLQWSTANKKWEPGTITVSGGTVTNVTTTPPLSVSSASTTPAISISQANGTTSGYLSSADWTTFNNKEGSLTAGTALQYYRGDKSWQTLDTSVVPENVNLYFTNARALGVPLTGFATGAGAIIATDSVLAAFGKAQGQINTLNTASSNYLIKNSTDSVTGVVNVGTTGLLQLVYTPVGLNDATNKAYVDSETGSKVSKTGDTMSGVLTLDSDLKIKGGTNYVTLRGHATSANYNFVFPQTAGTAGYVLSTDGSGNTNWVTPAVGSSNITDGSIVDADVNASAAIAQSKIANLTTDLAAKVSTTLTNGNILVGNGSNVATAVAVSGDATLSNTGALTLANTAVTAGTYKSVTVDGKGRVTGGTNPTTLAGYGITDTLVTGVSVTAPITNTGTAAVPLIGMPAATGAVDGYLTSANFTTFNNKQDAITSASNINTGSITTNLQNGVILNPNGANTGEIRFKELAGSGVNYTGFKAPGTLAGDVIYTLPIADGTSGQVLTTNASGVLSWSSISSTAAPIGAAGGDLSGSYPNPTISGLAATKVSTGIVDNTEFNYLDGVTSAIQTQLNGKQALDTGLTNFAAFNTNGILVQTANDTYAGRTITGTANRTVITNGDGVSGNPVINVDTGLLPSPAGAGQWLKSTAANTSAWTTLGSSDITTALGFTPINKAGDTISTGTVAFNAIGTLSLAYTPTNATDATSKSYVDNAVATGANQWTLNSGNVYRSSGSVGIGATPGASYKLDVNGSTRVGSSSTGVTLNIDRPAGNYGEFKYLTAGSPRWNLYTDSVAESGSNAGSDFIIQSYTDAGAVLGVPFKIARASGNILMNGSGNVGIGASSPTTKLTVSDGGTAAPYLSVDKLAVIGSGNTVLQVTSPNTATAALYFSDPDSRDPGGVSYSHATDQMLFRVNGANRMYIDNAGNVGIGTSTPSEKLEVSGNVKAAAFLYTSDKRLKKNIDTLDDALERVLNLRGVSFKWKENDLGEIGFIAQEVEEHEPLLVETSAASGMKSVKYGNIVALLVEAIKEENKVVEENSKMLSTMQNGLNKIEKKVSELSREVSSLKDDNKKLQDENRDLKKEIEIIKKHLKLK